ncbi:hypothetical protein Bca4012_093573 [Brassica carinata]
MLLQIIDVIPRQLCRPQSEEDQTSKPPPVARSNELLELPTATQPENSMSAFRGYRRSPLHTRTETRASSTKLHQSYANVEEPVSNSDEPERKNTTNNTLLQTDTKCGKDRMGKSWSHHRRKPGTGHRRPTIALRPKQWHTNNMGIATTTQRPTHPWPCLRTRRSPTKPEKKGPSNSTPSTRNHRHLQKTSPIRSKTPSHRIYREEEPSPDHALSPPRRKQI